MRRLYRQHLSRASALLALCLGFLSVASAVGASDLMTPRLQIGVKMALAIAQANQSLSGSNPGVSLPIYVVYRDNRHLAEQLEPGLSEVRIIRGHPVAVSSVRLDELLASSPGPMSVVFVAEDLGDDLGTLIGFGRERRLLLFSPYKGDVERGAAAGFRVTDKVLPMVNMDYLKATNIQLKAFFLRIAVKHE